MTQETVSLTSDDWNEIFTVEPFQIGKTILQLRPLDLPKITYIALLITNISEKVSNVLPEETDQKTILEVLPSILPTIVELVQSEVPEALSIMSGLAIDDVRKLPTNIVLDLSVKCIEVNLGSLESLSKNFVALIQKSQMLSQGIKNTTTTRETQKKKLKKR